MHADHAVELAAQLGNVKRLGDVIRRADARGFDRAFNRAVLREHHHRRLRMDLADALQQLEAAELRHAKIGHHDVDRRLLENFERFLGVRCRASA